VVSDPRCIAIARRLATPLRVAVSGRRGVGRSTVAHALAQAGNLRGTITLTISSAADVDLYVLADAVKPEDRAAIAAATRPLLAVLNKADLIATTESGCHPHGPTTAASSPAATDTLTRSSARTGGDPGYSFVTRSSSSTGTGAAAFTWLGPRRAGRGSASRSPAPGRSCR